MLIPITKVCLSATKDKEIEISTYHQFIVGETPKKYKMVSDIKEMDKPYTTEKEKVLLNIIEFHGFYTNIRMDKWIYAAKEDKEKIDETIKELMTFYKIYLLDQLEKLDRIKIK